MNNKLWTDESVETLRRMQLEGHSYTEIAKAIGNGCTRGAISGKIDRLGIGFRVPRGLRVTRPRIPKPVVVPVAVEPQGEPLSLRIPYAEAKAKQCKWISADPQVDSSICGYETKPLSPYCEFHHARSRQPAHTVRRETDAL